MTAFNADNFRGKLSRLSESSQSIQTLSGWIQYHKKHAVESAEVWAKETLVADPERQLLYIYLANDVMQHSRRKKTEQVKTFGGHMKAVLPAAYAAAPESVRSKLLRYELRLLDAPPGDLAAGQAQTSAKLLHGVFRSYDADAKPAPRQDWRDDLEHTTVERIIGIER